MCDINNTMQEMSQQKSLKSLRQELNRFKNLNKTLNSKIGLIEIKNKKFKNDLERYNQENEQLNGKCNKLKDDLQKNQEKLNEAEAELKNKIRENEFLNTSIDYHKQKSELNENQIDNLKRLLDQNSIGNQHDLNKRLKDQSLVFEEEKNELKGKIKQLENELKEMRDSYEKLEMENSDFIRCRGKIFVPEGDCIRIKKEDEAILRNENHTLKDTNNDLMNRYLNLESQFKRANERIDMLTRLNEDYCQEKRELELEWKKFKLENQDLKRENLNFEAEVKELKDKNFQLTNLKQVLSNNIKTLEIEQKELKEEIKNLKLKNIDQQLNISSSIKDYDKVLLTSVNNLMECIKMALNTPFIDLSYMNSRFLSSNEKLKLLKKEFKSFNKQNIKIDESYNFFLSKIKELFVQLGVDIKKSNETLWEKLSHFTGDLSNYQNSIIATLEKPACPVRRSIRLESPVKLESRVLGNKYKDKSKKLDHDYERYIPSSSDEEKNILENVTCLKETSTTLKPLKRSTHEEEAIE